MRSTLAHRPALTVLIAVFALVGCSSDIVFRDRAPFNDPPDAASGFLGYYDATLKQTTCGNCHVDYQAGWATTAHASAHAMLDASPAKAAECYSCHTVTARGNIATGTAGHDAVQNAAYFDVQCESCHGPGLPHVESVGRGAVLRPLASIAMSGTGNCGDCHSGGHHPLVDQWKLSGHGQLRSGTRVENPNCVGCHESRGVLAKWGEDADFREKATATNYQPAATCATCHDPHGSGNTAQLRFSISSTDPEQNLCIRCHLRVAEPTVTSSSPHAPQGAMLLGFAGWRPPGFVYDTTLIFGTHATEANPRLCAGCHVAKYNAPDQLTGGTILATSHLMRPIPCLDGQGLPTADKNCAYTATTRSWQTCTDGCHGNAQAAANVFNSTRDNMRSLVNVLWVDLNGNGTLDAAPADGGLLPTVKAMSPDEWSNTDNTITPAEGAEFNARLCGEYGQATSDNSKGVHNPFLCRALLSETTGTIAYIRSYYNLP
jgi:predicted CXXCH cytochrome family protein